MKVVEKRTRSNGRVVVVKARVFHVSSAGDVRDGGHGSSKGGAGLVLLRSGLVRGLGRLGWLVGRGWSWRLVHRGWLRGG